MSESEDDVPTESGEAPESEEAPGAPPAPSQVTVPARPRGRRSAIQKAKREELTKQWELRALDPARPVEAVFRGAGISAAGGLAEVIGDALKGLGRFLTELGGGDAYVNDLVFQNSLHVWLRPSSTELKRAQQDLELVERLQTDQRADIAQIERIREEAVPDLQLAAALAADLLAAPATEAPARSVAFGTAVTAAYKSLATTVARHHLTLELETPERPATVTLSPDKAERVSQELRSATEPQRLIEIVVGVLSMADAIHNGFALLLDPGPKPPSLENKRVVRGTFTPQVEDLIRERGLWGKRVRARIEVKMDPLISTSKIRPPQFRLLDVEEAVT